MAHGAAPNSLHLFHSVQNMASCHKTYSGYKKVLEVACLKKKRQLRKLGNMKKKNQTYCIPRWTKRELKGFFFGNLKKEKYTQDHVYLFFYANHLRQAR